MKKVSFICSCHNDAKFFDGWVKDLMQQTIIEDCQIVFVDCDSKQNEFEMIKQWKVRFPDIFTIIKLPRDKGLYHGWNVALKHATGKYVTNASMDDRRSPDFAEKLYNFMEENPELQVTYTDNYVSHVVNEHFLILDRKNKSVYSHGGEHSISGMLSKNLPHVMPFWKKDIHNKVGLFLETYPSCGDWEFWIRSTFLGIRFKRFPETLGIYYYNPEGLSTNPSNNSWKSLDEAYVKKSYTQYYREYILSDIKENTYDSFSNWWKSRNWKTHKADF